MTWEQSDRLKSGVGSATFSVSHKRGQAPFQIEATFRGWPRGTQIMLGKEQGVALDGDWHTTVGIKDVVLAQTMEDLRKPIDLKLGLAVAPPGHEASATMLPPRDVLKTLRLALLEVRDKGLAFAANDAPVEKPRGAAIVHGYELEFVGTATTPAELDWVVIAEDQQEPSGRKSCIYGQGGFVGLRFHDVDITVFDRRTGKQLTKAVIPKRVECPDKALLAVKEDLANLYVPTDEIVAWAKKQLTKP